MYFCRNIDCATLTLLYEARAIDFPTIVDASTIDPEFHYRGRPQKRNFCISFRLSLPASHRGIFEIGFHFQRQTAFYSIAPLRLRLRFTDLLFIFVSTISDAQCRNIALCLRQSISVLICRQILFKISLFSLNNASCYENPIILLCIRKKYVRYIFYRNRDLKYIVILY